MLLVRAALSMFSIGLIVLVTDIALGQDYPNKPIRIVGGAVGGAGDFAARIIAHGVATNLGWQVIVDNRAAGIVPVEIVAKAPPDGYTLHMGTQVLWGLPLLREVPYDPVKDFAPLMIVEISPNIVIVHPSLPVKSVKELIAYAKDKPGALNASTGSTGGSGHVALEMFKSMAGVNIVRVPYSSGPQEQADLMGGHVQMTIGLALEVSPLVKIGKMRALAVTTPKKTPLFPDLPTVAETIPGYQWVGMRILAAPAKTPAPIIALLNREFARVLKSPDVVQKFFAAGSDVAAGTPEELGAWMKTDMIRLAKLYKEAGISVK